MLFLAIDMIDSLLYKVVYIHDIVIPSYVSLMNGLHLELKNSFYVHPYCEWVILKY